MNRASKKDPRKEVAPDRKHLGPTGPSQMPPDSKQPDVEKHPNAGNVGKDKPIVTPVPGSRQPARR
jgi:hypothetical protein